MVALRLLVLVFLAIATGSGCREATQVLLTSVDPADSGISFYNTITETESLNIHEYLYAYNGGGVGIGDFDNDGLPDIYFTANQTENRLYHNLGSFRFEDITEQAGVGGATGSSAWTTGVSVADVNGDGLLDIYVSQVSFYGDFTGHNRLYINQGNLTFMEQAVEYGLDLTGYCQQAAFFDYDGDGDLDLFQLRHSVHNPDVYLRADQREKRDSLAGDLLLRNDGGFFREVSDTSGIYGGATGYGLAIAISDIDGNGCPDIYVSNDFHENDYVYYNDCTGVFREDIRGTLGHSSTFSMGNDIADVNNDGRPDILTLDMKPGSEVLRKQLAGTDPYTIYNYKLSFGYFYQFPRNMLQLNRGQLFGRDVQFSEVGELAGVSATDWSWGGILTDLDNDGWKDIFITNGIPHRPIDQDFINYTYDQQHRSESALQLVARMPDGAAKNYAFQNDKNGRFRDRSADWGLDLSGYSNGAAAVDLDADGDLDLVVNNLNAPASLYLNNSQTESGNHYLRIQLKGAQGNRFGIGARITVEVGEQTIQQEMFPVRGWLSSGDHYLNFGLGTATIVDRLTVRWPSGRVEVQTGLAVDTLLILQQDDATQAIGPDKHAAAHPIFEDVTEESGIGFFHRENNYLDFTLESLIPHLLSTEGPRMDVGDVDGDGIADLYVGGAHGQAGSIYLGKEANSSVSFAPMPGPAFEKDKRFEDAGVQFADVDQDGDLDLYAVSGGGENRGPADFRDRLYLNDGAGNFAPAPPASLPEVATNGSCVVGGDFNNDGAVDFFVGGRSVPGGYGLAPASNLLINDGLGRFSLDSAFRPVLQHLGMVTDAVWVEDDTTLVIVGEWMPVTLLRFGEAGVTIDSIAGTAGWWNTVHASDLDGDGDQDLIAGNLGYNTAFGNSAEDRIRLYVKDFDQNSSTDPLLTYFREGAEWIYTDLNQLKKQMPSVGRSFPTYASFSERTFQEIMTFDALEGSRQLRADLLGSVCLMRRGGGQYDIVELPEEVQYAPVYAIATGDFDRDGHCDILTAGNLHGVVPSVGKLDASYGTLLRGDGTGRFTVADGEASGFAVYGEVRALRVIPGTDYVVALRNNAPARVLRVQAWAGALKK